MPAISKTDINPPARQNKRLSIPEKNSGNYKIYAGKSQAGDTFEKKHSKLKKAGIILGITASVAGILALGHKTGIAKKIPSAGRYIDRAGKAVCSGVKTAADRIKSRIKHKERIKVSPETRNAGRGTAEEAVRKIDAETGISAGRTPHIPAEDIPDELWEEHAGMDMLRYHIFEDAKAYELLDDFPSGRRAEKPAVCPADSIRFDYDNLRLLNIENFDISTDGKGVRGAGIFSKTNKKFTSKLKECGLETVIDLRAESNVQKSIQQCERNGLQYIHFPIDYNQKLCESQINSLKNLLPLFFEAMDRGKYYIGCVEGTNRTDVAFGLNYLLNPNEIIPPHFKSKSPHKSLDMTRRIVNAILQKTKDGKYIYIDDEFIKKLGWENIQSFIEQYTKRQQLLGSANI